MYQLIIDRQYKVSAVVGLSSSRKAVMSANLLSIFKIPNLSLYATSDELSDKTRFEYFMRLLPADKNQVRLTLYPNAKKNFLFHVEVQYTYVLFVLYYMFISDV